MLLIICITNSLYSLPYTCALCNHYTNSGGNHLHMCMPTAVMLSSVLQLVSSELFLPESSFDVFVCVACQQLIQPSGSSLALVIALLIVYTNMQRERGSKREKGRENQRGR